MGLGTGGNGATAVAFVAGDSGLGRFQNNKKTNTRRATSELAISKRRFITGLLHDLENAQCRDNDEPDGHERPKQLADAIGPDTLEPVILGIYEYAKRMKASQFLNAMTEVNVARRRLGRYFAKFDMWLSHKSIKFSGFESPSRRE